eukprot:CAMPEP_0195512564 /NCGR_PEP_ID=MMETSP0794_2-20130614/4476_1 /TAXON_ID=515487 /ORGANISM="Stephanopyxis turris, Strain CCMP 815" /LENGTH=272 /DNA_ID=CAMNT_0040640373 /DNA_START=102 /DNA_END=920 /DNA_ORIENTATION=+
MRSCSLTVATISSILAAFPQNTVSFDLNHPIINRIKHLPSIETKKPLSPEHSLTLLQAGLGDVWAGITKSPPSELDPPVSLLAGTSIDPNNPNVDLTRCYKASVDGWSATDFHRCVDGRGSAVVVALSSSSSKRFGGFNPLGWMSTDDYGSSNSAFLWFEKGGTEEVIKAPVLQGGGACLFDYATGGPCFGAGDLQIGPPQAAVMGGFAGPDMEDTSVNAGSLKVCKSSPGGAYDYVNGWPCRGSATLVEVEVYCNENVKASSSEGPSWWPF